VESALLTVTIEYQFGTDLSGGEEDSARVLADSLGINFNPSIIWNALPWSFVIDWLAGVSSWLNQYKVPVVTIRTEIMQCCASIKVSRKTTSAINGSTAFTVEEEAYKRFLPALNFEQAIRTSGLSLREFSLGAALGFSKGL
jgi:hypothetical protein